MTQPTARPTMQVRAMTAADLPAVMRIQARCYGEGLPESAASLNAKRLASPDTCFIAETTAAEGDGIVGYLFSVPWHHDGPPEHNARHCDLPASPTCLYLHDLAVDPSVQHGGAGTALVGSYLKQLDALGLADGALIAVQGSAAYWARHGFRPEEGTPALQIKLRTYGPHAIYMVRPGRAITRA